VLRGEPSDITLDIRTMRKDVLSAIATGARNGVSQCRQLPVRWRQLAAAVAGRLGRKGFSPKCRDFFRDFMLQDYP